MTTMTKRGRYLRSLPIQALLFAVVNGVFGLLRDVRAPIVVVGTVLCFALYYGLGRAKQSEGKAARWVFPSVLIATVVSSVALVWWVLFAGSV